MKRLAKPIILVILWTYAGYTGIQFLALWMTETRPADFARRLNALKAEGELAYRQRNFGDARSAFDRALLEAESGDLGDDFRENLWYWLAVVDLAEGEYGDAETRLRRAIACADRRGSADSNMLVHYRTRLGQCLAAQSRWTDAEQELAACVSDLERFGLTEMRAATEMLLSQCAMQRSDPAGAESHARKAKLLAEKSADYDLFARCVANLGDIFRLNGKMPPADAQYEIALAAYLQSPNRNRPAIEELLARHEYVLAALGRDGDIVLLRQRVEQTCGMP